MPLHVLQPDPPAEPEHRLCLEHLTKRYPGADAPAVDDLSFCVAAGEVFALVGPSGCGKTTTLRTIAGLERADEGFVRHGELVCQNPQTFLPPERRGIGLVFQDYALFPHLNVLRNVMYGLKAGSRREKKKQAQHALELVGLPKLDRRSVQDLSGGQQQRVALARAIAPGTDVLLLDEPFSNLDAELRGSIRHELKEIVRRTDLALILVTHDQEEAMSTADRVAVMRDGRVIQMGSPEAIYRRPRSAFVAQFLGRTNLLPGDAAGKIANTPLGMVELDREINGPVLLSLRPEHLALEFNPDPRHAVRVLAREFKGHDLTYRVQLHERELLIQTDAGCIARVGDLVRLRPLAAAVAVEDDRTGGAANKP